MRIAGGGSPNVNLLFSDTAQFRNADFVVNSNGAFWLYSNITGAAGEKAHIQIFNPAGSGVTVLVDGILASSNADNFLNVAYHDTELTTDVGAWVSKLRGGAAGAAHIRQVSNNGNLGTIITGQYVLASSPLNQILDASIELLSGEGCHAIANVNGTALACLFWGREV